jgi:meiotic recombination protein REC8
MELRNSELAEWNSGYITNMDKVAKHRQAAKAAVQAKKNAQHWVLNSGIAGVGQGLGGSKLVSPLDMFTGDTLMRALAIYPDQIAGTRRSFDFEKVERESESQERRKLRRVDDENLRDQGQAMNIADEDIGPIFDDNVSILNLSSFRC